MRHFSLSLLVSPLLCSSAKLFVYRSYSLARQDEDLVIMIIIRALPEEFDNFMSALLLQKDIDKAKV